MEWSSRVPRCLSSRQRPPFSFGSFIRWSVKPPSSKLHHHLQDVSMLSSSLRDGQVRVSQVIALENRGERAGSAGSRLAASFARIDTRRIDPTRTCCRSLRAHCYCCCRRGSTARRAVRSRANGTPRLIRILRSGTIVINIIAEIKRLLRTLVLFLIRALLILKHIYGSTESQEWCCMVVALSWKSELDNCRAMNYL